jgi:pseudomonalisin
MTSRRRSFLAVLAAASLAAQAPAGAAEAARAGIAGADRVVAGSVHPLARPEAAVGRTNARLPMARIVVALARRPGAQARLERLLAEQQDPGSPRFHRWLTPAEFGAEFGLGDEDVERVAAWLRGQGFAVDEVAAGRGWMQVSGTAGQVERAFATEMRDYRVAGELHHANAVAPSIPRALSGLVRGIVSLHDFPLTSTLSQRRAAAGGERLAPAGGGAAPDDNGADGAHLLAPADLATIYHLGPLYASWIDGTGQSIAVTGRTDIKLADVQAFRANFGLPPNDPVFVHNGPDPGIIDFYDEGESDLDVEWAGALAPRATVELVISGSTAATDGIMLSAQYIVDHDLAAVMSTSYGNCEAALGSTTVMFWGDLYTQAAAQGITAFVASGDSGAALCSPPSSARGFMASVNGLCTAPYAVCVGGTELDDTADPAAWWSPANDPVTKGSALSYIPEVAWNESGSVAGGSGLWASGGGASTVFPKPAWQTGPGVPDDGARDVPDVALAAARHTAYIYLEEQQQLSIGGTSGASPAFAGLMAMVVQRARERQGYANIWFYVLASHQAAGTGPAVFHDVTSGNNSVPGVAGYAAGPGYDQVTGLGSPDGAALVNGWPALRPGAWCTPGPGTLCIDDQPGDGRFSIAATFVAGSQAGNAAAIPLASVGVAQGGLFWFFAAANPELLIKVLDACQLNQQFWVFYAAGTNVGFTVTVTDTKTGRSKQYTNPQGTAAPPIQDTAAIPCG